MSVAAERVAVRKDGTVLWAYCVYCRTPYEAADLHSIGSNRYACRWHFARLKR
jgi:hypothetical protein